MFDTHCHLNFQAFEGKIKEVIADASENGVNQILIPGTDVATSKKAVEIAEKFPNVFAAVGVHPHHVYELQMKHAEFSTNEIDQIEKLLQHPKAVAVGEVGLDKHYYQKTKYEKYQVDEQFISLQKEVLEEQIQLAIQYDKSLILHNRESKKDFLEMLDSVWDKKLEGRTVFHCCEPDQEFLTFAQEHNVYIGVDGDVTYSKEKEVFVKKIPLDRLVLETDSPFLTPEPHRSEGRRTNTPTNLPLIASHIASLTGVSEDEIKKASTSNAISLFHIKSQTNDLV